MIIVVKSNKIIATHDESQSISAVQYPDADAILKVSDIFKPMQEYVVTTEQIASSKIEQLWTAVKKYVDDRLDVAGYYTLDKVCANPTKTKAKACVDWYNAVWNEYYVRRAQAVAGQNPSVDFSSTGDIPYTFSEAYSQS
jgi:hypothetical protein